MTGSGERAGERGGPPGSAADDRAPGPGSTTYWLGGKDNFAADRASRRPGADDVRCREILDTVRGNRQFLVRAVRYLRDAGTRQFIDIGSGLPSSPNVHEIAQAGGTGARVVYVGPRPGGVRARRAR